MKMVKYPAILVNSVMSVGMDLLSTALILRFPGFYETRTFGNMPLVEYTIVVGVSTLIFCLEEICIRDGDADAVVRNHILSFFYSCLPYLGVINNIAVFFFTPKLGVAF